MTTTIEQEEISQRIFDIYNKLKNNAEQYLLVNSQHGPALLALA